jgi:hypothetical protein
LIHLAFIFRTGSKGMIRTLLALPLLAAAASVAASEPPEFESSPEPFADAGACLGHLQHLVADARGGDFDAVEGPYTLAPADVRAHMVRSEGLGHRISEFRCAGEQLSSRSWVERMDRRADGAFSIEALAGAEWLEQGSRQ